jgi:hypothetical protein
MRWKALSWSKKGSSLVAWCGNVMLPVTCMRWAAPAWHNWARPARHGCSWSGNARLLLWQYAAQHGVVARWPVTSGTAGWFGGAGQKREKGAGDGRKKKMGRR